MRGPGIEPLACGWKCCALGDIRHPAAPAAWCPTYLSPGHTQDHPNPKIEAQNRHPGATYALWT
eukprot:6847307-Lingulodinium_polyedra.AAC.1